MLDAFFALAKQTNIVIDLVSPMFYSKVLPSFTLRCVNSVTRLFEGINNVISRHVICSWMIERKQDSQLSDAQGVVC